MPDKTAHAKAIDIALLGRQLAGKEAVIPALLSEASRAAGGVPNPFVNEQVVEVEAVYDLSPPAH